jgi:hypothetical protein
MLALLVWGSAALAEERGTAPLHHAGLRTGTLLFPASGMVIATLGVEYLPDVTNDLAGVDGEILRVAALDLRLGLADRAMFVVSWPAFNRLRVHSQVEPPPLGRRLGPVSTDWGDVTVATLIRLHAERGRWPAAGLRFAAKLPNTNEKLGIGDNTTDVFATALFGKSFASRASVSAEAGLGILTERTTFFAQNDVFSYGLLADCRVRERLVAVGEVSGYAATHAGGPGTRGRSELRAGLELSRRTFHWTALVVRGLSGWDSRGVGVAIHASTGFTLFEREARPR